MPIKFHKVSDNQFEHDFDWPVLWGIKPEINIKMPKRATKNSAGYDFFAPFHFRIDPGDSFIIPTGIKAELPSGYFLMMVPRSGLGFKYQLGIANTIGIIDSDYFNNENNEGHILIKLVNRGDKFCFIDAGQAFCQGIIMKYGVTDDDIPAKEVRAGGIGSTDKNE